MFICFFRVWNFASEKRICIEDFEKNRNWQNSENYIMRALQFLTVYLILLKNLEGWDNWHLSYRNKGLNPHVMGLPAGLGSRVNSSVIC